MFVVAALLGILSGVLFAYAGDLPQVSALDNYSPSTITRLYSAQGQVIGEFATQRRVVVGYDDINPLLRQAIIATEDAEFERHIGVNVWRIFVAAFIDIVERRRDQGASTLTQQVARNLDQFGLTKQKLFERKIREIVLAIQIEKRYSKKEIFTIYCNQMYMGHGAYGVEAASRLYFDKTNKQLTLEEAALIAGIFQSPERQSPFVDMKRATSRRNIVLQRMADERYITQAQADEAKQKPIVTRGQPNQPPGIAPFFVEEVRKHLERQYGAKVLYENGLAVTTTLDARPAGPGQPRDRARAARVRQAPRLAQADAQRARRRQDASTPYRDDRWNRPIAAGRRRAGRRRHGAEGRARPACGSGAITPTSAAKATPGRARRRPPTSSSLAISSTSPIDEDRRGDRRGHRDARTDAARRSRAARDRQPHRPDQGDGRRLELQPQQVQPCGAGVSVSSDRRSSRSSTPRRSIAASRRRRSSSTRRSATRPATGRSTARTTTTTSSWARSRCGTRSRSRATSRRSR